MARVYTQSQSLMTAICLETNSNHCAPHLHRSHNGTPAAPIIRGRIDTVRRPTHVRHVQDAHTHFMRFASHLTERSAGARVTSFMDRRRCGRQIFPHKLPCARIIFAKKRCTLETRQKLPKKARAPCIQLSEDNLSFSRTKIEIILSPMSIGDRRYPAHPQNV